MNPDPTQFEEPILQLRRRIEETTAAEGDPVQVAALEAELTKVADEIYANLTPWQKTLVARHPQRPYTLDFIGYLFDEWTEILVEFPRHPFRRGDVPHRLVASPCFERRPRRGGLLCVSCEHAGHLLGSRTYES